MVRILLSQLLTERKSSQAKFARITGIRPNTICDLYNETAAQIRLDLMDLICEDLECDISDLFALEPDEEPPSQGICVQLTELEGESNKSTCSIAFGRSAGRNQERKSVKETIEMECR